MKPIAAPLRNRIENLVALARLLERVEHDPRAAALDAGLYRNLAAQVSALLDDDELPRAALDAVLGAFPSVAELYENLTYARAGLSRAPLDRAAAAEVRARELIARVARR